MASQPAPGAHPHPPAVVRFGVFEFDTRTRELRKHGVRLRLQGRPCQILQALVERPGQVVTREELRQRLWPSDVFVDYESGLNTAANRLRLALGDSAENPRFIETLARTGYRFIAPVEVANVTSTPSPPRLLRAWRFSPPQLAVVLVLIVAAIGGAMALSRSDPPDFQFRPVTFRRGQVWGARFAPDGRAVLYTANWENGPRRLFITDPVSPESRALGFDHLRLVSVSRTGELALLSFDGTMPITGGALSRVPMNGGAPLPVERSVMSADWAPDGRLAIVRAVDGSSRLEFPPGSVVHETSGWIGGVRVSPRGDRIAFIEHPVRNDTRGTLKLVDRDRVVRTLSDEWANAGGVAWHPDEDEIWLTASRDGAPKSLWAVALSGKTRPLAHIAGTLTLRDISPDGRVLASRETERLEMAALVGSGRERRDLSWLDWSRVVDLSPDGRRVLFDESGVAGGPEYLVYLHDLHDGSTVRVGEGLGLSLTADGRFALTLSQKDRTRLRLLPLGEGKPIDLPPTGLEYQWVRYFPDGKRLLALASQRGGPLRLYVQSGDEEPFPITPPTVVRNVAISPDGSQVAMLPADGRLRIYPTLAEGEAWQVPIEAPLAPLLWVEDEWLYVQHLGAYTEIPTRLSRLHLPTGRLEPWLQLEPDDLAGVNAITKVMLSADAGTVVFNYRRVLSELFVAQPAAR